MATTREMRALLIEGIKACREEDYLRALNLFSDVYSANAAEGPSEGLSYYGLCCALVEKRYDDGADLCRRAIAAEETRALHYVNLTRINVAAGRRREALEALEAGLAHAPDDDELVALRREFGVRSRPAVSFLPRTNPINKALGRVRHARKEEDDEEDRHDT